MQKNKYLSNSWRKPCFHALQMLVGGIDVMLIVLSVLELCVIISSVVLGIKALKSKEKPENQVESVELPPMSSTYGLPRKGLSFTSSSVKHFKTFHVHLFFLLGQWWPGTLQSPAAGSHQWPGGLNENNDHVHLNHWLYFNKNESLGASFLTRVAF